VHTGRVVFKVAAEEVEAVEGVGARCDDAAALVESCLVAERCLGAHEELTSEDEGACDALDDIDLFVGLILSCLFGSDQSINALDEEDVLNGDAAPAV
jgi:hypothetical protein